MSTPAVVIIPGATPPAETTPAPSEIAAEVAEQVAETIAEEVAEVIAEATPPAVSQDNLLAAEVSGLRADIPALPDRIAERIAAELSDDDDEPDEQPEVVPIHIEQTTEQVQPEKRGLLSGLRGFLLG